MISQGGSTLRLIADGRFQIAEADWPIREFALGYFLSGFQPSPWPSAHQRKKRYGSSHSSGWSR
jgi:hypothetical protein